MINVFHNQDDFVLFGSDWIDRLRETAKQSSLRRARLCLHRSDDDLVQEMMIALSRDCLFSPHRHPTKNESIHMIEGRVIMILFNENGGPQTSFLLAPPSQHGLVAYRLCRSEFHTILPLDEVVIYHETTSGPFVPGEAVFAEWAPSDSAALKAFLVDAALKCGIPPSLLKSTQY